MGDGVHNPLYLADGYLIHVWEDSAISIASESCIIFFLLVNITCESAAGMIYLKTKNSRKSVFSKKHLKNTLKLGKLKK